MTRVDAPGLVSAYEAALAATAAALEADEPLRAAEASAVLARAVGALEAERIRLSPEALARAQALQRRCVDAAGGVQRRLAGALALAAQSRRAGAAYRRR